MPARAVVVCDLAAGEARIGGSIVNVRTQPGGALIVGDRVLRPLRFGERWRLLAGLDRAHAVGAVGAAVGAVAGSRLDNQAEQGTPPVDEAICQVLALHLAGARPGRAVPGCAQQLADLVAAGWTPRDVLDADADLIDLLAESLYEDEDDGWTSIVLGADRSQPSSVAEVLALLEGDLLSRLAPAERDPAERDEDEVDGHDHRAIRVDPADQDTRARFENAATVPRTINSAVSHPAELNRALINAGADAGPPPIFALDRPEHPQGIAAQSTSPEPPRRAAPIMNGPGLDHPAAIRRRRRPTSLLPVAGELRPSVPAVSDHLQRSMVAPGRPDSLIMAAGAALTLRAFGRDPATTAAPPVPAAGRAGPDAAPTSQFGEAAVPTDVLDLADQVAALIDEESDLRGLRR